MKTQKAIPVAPIKETRTCCVHVPGVGMKLGNDFFPYFLHQGTKGMLIDSRLADHLGIRCEPGGKVFLTELGVQKMIEVLHEDQDEYDFFHGTPGSIVSS